MIKQYPCEWIVIKQYSPYKWVILGKFHKKREAKRYRKIVESLSLFAPPSRPFRFIHVEVALIHQATQKGIIEYPEDLPMTYRQQLFDWIVLREVSPCNWVILSEFRRRNDADNYHQLVKKLFCDPVEIVFRERLREFNLKS